MNIDGAVAATTFLSGYFVGGIPFGVLAARLRGVDLRNVGSGNIGATNVGRALGRAWGVIVLLLDIGKGFVSAFVLPPLLAGDASSGHGELLGIAAGLGAILGHIFPPYLRFRGGKGVATSIGAFGALLWYWIALPLVFYVAARKLTGYVSAGSIALAALLPAAAFLHMHIDGAGGWPTVAFAGAMGALIVLRHRENIARLVRGEELAATGTGGAPASGDEGDGDPPVAPRGGRPPS